MSPAFERLLRLAAGATLAFVLLAIGTAATGRSEAPAAAATSGRLHAFVALEDTGQVAVLRGPPWRVARRVDVPLGPHNVVTSSDCEFVAVTSPPAGAVTLIRARTGAVVRTVRIAGGPHGAAFSPSGRTLWIAAERAALLLQRLRQAA